MKKTIKNAISSLTAKLAALFLLAFGCAGSAWGADPVTIQDANGNDISVYEVSPGFYQSAGNYTKITDFYITSKAGLKFFRDMVSACDGGTAITTYVQGGFYSGQSVPSIYSNNMFNGKTVHLLCDVDLGNEDWTPIGYPNLGYNSGNSKTQFYGSFDGHNHVISNVKVVADSNNQSNAKAGNEWKNYGSYGLFGHLPSSGSTFRNLTVHNFQGVVGATVTSNPSVGAGDYVGAIAGNAGSNIVTFDNCKVTGTISISGTYTGAICGIGNANIVNCEVSGDTGSTISGDSFAGGLVGSERCSATSNLSLKDNTVSGVTVSSSQFAGGVVGALSNGAKGTLMVLDNDSEATLSGSGATDAFICANNGSTTAVAVGENATFDESGKVTGGIFEVINEELIASGYLAVDNPDNTTSASYPLTVGGPYVATVSDANGTFKSGHATFAAALAAALDGETVTLISGPDTAISAAGEVTGGKTITVTGTAKFNWAAGWLQVGRGSNPGNGTLIFKDATITSSSTSTGAASTGINISGHEKGSPTKNDGTVIIDNSYIECRYLIDKGTLKVIGNGTVGATPNLVVLGGFDVCGRPANETESGEDATAYMELSNGAYVQVKNINGLGVGREGNGVVSITGGSKFEHDYANGEFINLAKGTVSIDATSEFVGQKMGRAGTILVDATGAETEVKVFDLTDTSSLSGSVTVNNLSADAGVVYGSDGDVTIKPGSFVAMVGETKYENLADAIYAAYNGGTVTLLTDVTVADWEQNVYSLQGASAGTAAGPNGLVIDGNGHSLTVSSLSQNSVNNGAYLLSKGNFTVKNLTVNLPAGATGFAPQGGSFENVTINGGKRAMNLQWTTDTVTIDGCTIANTSSSAFYTEGGTKVAVNDSIFDHASLSINGEWSFTSNTVKNASADFGSTNVTFKDNDLSEATVGLWADNVDLSENYWGAAGDYESKVAANNRSYTVDCLYTAISKDESGSIQLLSNLAYKVKFVNFDGSTLFATNVVPGGVASYEGATPAKPGDETSAYAFSGWDPATIVAVTDASQTYTAQFAAATAVAAVFELADGGATTNNYASYSDLHSALEAGKAAGKTVALLADIDLAGVAWVPVQDFGGIFDGNGKTIANLVVNTPDSDYAGLIGKTVGSGSSVKNVTIENATVTGRGMVGAVIGQVASSSTVSNLVVKGLVQVSGNYKVGGIAGWGYVYFRDSHIIGDEGSFVKATYLGTKAEVANNPENNDYEGDNVGGIIGHLGEGGGLGLYDCSVSGLTITGTRKIGGMVGTFSHSSQISNAAVSGVTLGTTATLEYANSNKSTMHLGGIVGSYFGDAKTGTISGTVEDVTILVDEFAEGISFAAGNVNYGLVAGGSRAATDYNPENLLADWSGVIAKGYDAAKYSNDYLINNYKAKVENGNGAFVGYYGSVAEAVAASSTGYTITLVDDVDENVNLSTWKNNAITFDLGGCTLTGQIIAPYGAKTDGIVIRNGNIVGRDSSRFYCLQFGYGSGNATLENLSVAQTSKDYRSYAVFFQQTDKRVTMRNVTLDGRFYTANSGSTIAIESGVYKNSTGLSNADISNGGVVAAIGGTFYYNPTTPNNLVAKGYVATETTDDEDVQCWVVELGPAFAKVTLKDGTETEFWDLDEAIGALAEGATLTIKPDTYTLASANYTLPKDVKIIGVEENGARVKITSCPTFNSANGLTIENVDFDGGYSWQPSAVTVHGDATFKNCTITCKQNAVYYSTVNGTLTFDGCTITAGVYALNIGEGTGDVIVKNCTISGWTSFGNVGKTIITGTTFEEGNYNYLRFYQDAVIDDCSFNNDMSININATGKKLIVSDSAFENGSSVASAIGQGEDDDPPVDNYIAVGTRITTDEDGFVTGGVFDKIDDGIIADGYISVDNLDGETKEKYPLTVGGPFAAVILDQNGGFVNGYTSLAAAVEAVPADGTETTIQLIANVELSATVEIPAEKNVVLDLNGKTVSVEAANVIKNNGTLAIQNGSLAITNAGSGKYYAILSEGDLTANAVTINSTSGGIRVKGTGVTGTLTDCNITTETTVTTYAHGVYASDGANVTIKSGVYSYTGPVSQDTVQACDDGTVLTIEGGTFTAALDSVSTPNATPKVLNNNGSGAVVYVKGGTFNGDLGASNGDVFISGGTFSINGLFSNKLAVSGGIFNFEVTQAMCAVGYSPAANTDAETKDAYPFTVAALYEAHIVRNGEVVAGSGGALADVLAAAEAGDTVQLLKDVDLGTTGLVIDADKNFTLDIGEYDITGTVNGKLITNNGTVVVNGTTGCIYNKDISAQGHDAFLNNGTATINGGWFGDADNDKTNANAINRGAGFRNFGTATINGGHFTACDNYTNGGYAYAIINGNGDNNPTLTINNADVYGKNNGNIANNSGSVTVKGGTFDVSGSQSYYSVYSYSGDTVVTGGTFTKSGNNNSQFCVEVDEDNASNPGSIAVSGGNFTKAVPEEYCAPGYIPAAQDPVTHMYTVKEGCYVARIGTTKYETLAEAVAAVKAAASGERTTVTLLTNTTEVIEIDFTYPILIDGQGFGISQAAASAHTGIKITAPHADVIIQNATVGNANVGRAVNILGAEGVTLLIKDSALYGNYYPLNVYPNGAAGVDNENITVTNSVISGPCALNLWGTNGVVKVVDSTLSATNTWAHSSGADGNDFGVIVLEGLTGTPGANGYNIEIKGSTIEAAQTTGNMEHIVLFNPNSQGNTVKLDGCVISRNGDTTHHPVIDEEANTSGNSLYVRNTTDAATSAIPVLPDGYAYANADSEGWRLVIKPVVAVIAADGVTTNGVYGTLEAAYDAASAGETITLLADITYGADRSVPVWDKAVNIDLGGHTLTTNSEVNKDASNNGYKAAAICFSIPAANAGSVTICNGTIVTAYGAGVYADDPGLTLTLSNLTINAATVGTQSTAEYSAAVRVTYGSKVIIESGTYSGAYAIAASNSGADFEINGGTFTGDIFFSGYTDSGKTKSVTITGGKFNGGFVNADKGTLAISGGVFAQKPADSYAATGYVVVPNTDSATSEAYPWTVAGAVASITVDDDTTYYATFAEAIAAADEAVANGDPDPVIIALDPTATQDNGDWKFVTDSSEPPVTTLVRKVYVAQIVTDGGATTNKFESLAEAIAAVPTTGAETTITMIDNSVEPEDITIAATKNIVLDLNGKTVSRTVPGPEAFFVTNKGTLTVQDTSANADGSIVLTANTSNYSKQTVAMYNLGGTLTLASGMIKNATGGGLAYAVNNAVNWGHVSRFTMTGGTISAPGGDAALRVYNNTAFSVSADCKNYVNISGGTILDTGIFIDTYLAGTYSASFTGDNLANEINISGGTVNGLIDLKIRHPFNTALNITGGDFTNTKMWVRKHGEYNASLAEPDKPMVYISGGKFAFDAGMAFGLAYDCGATSWTSYEKPYAVSGGVFNLEVPTFACAEGYIPADNTDADTMAAYPHTVAFTGDIIYPIEGTDGVRIALAWATNNTSVVSEGAPVTAADVPAIIEALGENGANGIPKWQGYVLGLNPADATAVLRLAATAKDASTVTITGIIDTTKFPTIANVTVTFRLASRNADGTWSNVDGCTGAATPSFDVALDDVAGKVLAIFADIVTE